jgi:hypothetical protein
MCKDDIECDAECAEDGGGGDMASGILLTWIRLGGRGGGPIDPLASLLSNGFATTVRQLATKNIKLLENGKRTHIAYSVMNSVDLVL